MPGACSSIRPCVSHFGIRTAGNGIGSELRWSRRSSSEVTPNARSGTSIRSLRGRSRRDKVCTSGTGRMAHREEAPPMPRRRPRSITRSSRACWASRVPPRVIASGSEPPRHCCPSRFRRAPHRGDSWSAKPSGTPLSRSASSATRRSKRCVRHSLRGRADTNAAPSGLRLALPPVPRCGDGAARSATAHIRSCPASGPARPCV